MKRWERWGGWWSAALFTPPWPSAGLRHDLHLLLVQKPQVGALLTTVPGRLPALHYVLPHYEVLLS